MAWVPSAPPRVATQTVAERLRARTVTSCIFSSGMICSILEARPHNATSLFVVTMKWALLH